MSESFVTEKLIKRVVDFHGHMCPGLALGIRVAQLALREIGPHAGNEEVVAVVETDMCGIDAIQVLTGCTFGKGNLVYKDYGKKAFSFYRRSDGKGIRIVDRPKVFASFDSEREKLLAKLQNGALTAEEEQRFTELRASLIEKILNASLEDLFEMKEPVPQMPAPAQVHRSIVCDVCGEAVMETRIKYVKGKKLCIPCSMMPAKK
ncbi:MAG: FmdE family protein [Syntrophobacteraceae bacterium]